MHQIYDIDLLEQRIEQEWENFLLEAAEARNEREAEKAESVAEWLDETN